MNFIKLGNSLNSAIGINFGIFSVARIPRVTGCGQFAFVSVQYGIVYVHSSQDPLYKKIRKNKRRLDKEEFKIFY